MNIIRNPARSRPLSPNVRRLMAMEREEPLNPNVHKAERRFTERDRAYCTMQGSIFMAALDKSITMPDFAPLYMTSQLAGVMDHSFSCSGNMDDDNVSNMLKIPLLLKSPETIVDVALWLNNIVCNAGEEASPTLAVAQALNDDATVTETKSGKTFLEDFLPMVRTLDAWTDEYEYAYWLGYIYRYECLLHDESSRMVYGAFSEDFMRQTYHDMMEGGMKNEVLASCAGEICKQLDRLLIGKLWK